MEQFFADPSHVVALLLLFVLLVGGVLGLFLFSIHQSTKMPGNSAHVLPTDPLGGNEKAIARTLRNHVRTLSDEIGPRSIQTYDKLSEAALYLENKFLSYGFSVRQQEFAPGGYARTVVNIEAERKGSLLPDEIIVVGAHYDSLGTHCPGADDNASGCAALLWLAEQFREITPSRTIRFVAFVNEETPFFKTNEMGSYRYAKEAKQKNEKILGMLCLESLGFYSQFPQTQRYPFPLSWWYPDTGNFLAFIGNWNSGELLRKSVRTFRTVSDVPSQGFAGPGWFPGVSWSDHWSFWKHGYPAFMLTDSAPFRNQYYHTENDRWDTLDYATFSRIMPGIMAIVKDLLRVKE